MAAGRNLPAVSMAGRFENSMLFVKKPNVYGPSAFTLIELLIVVAIIAILASILLPALNKGKLKALQAACMSNEKEMAIACKMYFDDNGTTFFNNGGGQGQGIWMVNLISYQSTVQKVRICPMTPELFGAQIPANSMYGAADKVWYYNGVPYGGNPNTTEYQGGYGLNGYFYYDRDTTINFQKESMVKFPAETPLIADALWCDAWPDVNQFPPYSLYTQTMGSTANDPSGSTEGIERFCIARHGSYSGHPTAKAHTQWPAGGILPGSINVAFADAHVKLVRLDLLWTLYWYRGWTPESHP